MKAMLSLRLTRKTSKGRAGRRRTTVAAGRAGTMATEPVYIGKQPGLICLLRMRAFFVALIVSAVGHSAFAQAPLSYRLTFPEPEHRWMRVELTLADLPATPL